MHTQAEQARQTSLTSLLVTARTLVHTVNKGGYGHEDGARDGSTIQGDQGQAGRTPSARHHYQRVHSKHCRTRAQPSPDRAERTVTYASSAWLNDFCGVGLVFTLALHNCISKLAWTQDFRRTFVCVENMCHRNGGST